MHLDCPLTVWPDGGVQGFTAMLAGLNTIIGPVFANKRLIQRPRAAEHVTFNWRKDKYWTKLEHVFAVVRGNCDFYGLIKWRPGLGSAAPTRLVQFWGIWGPARRHHAQIDWLSMHFLLLGYSSRSLATTRLRLRLRRLAMIKKMWLMR